MKKALILGKVWPEPGSSAAGVRLLQLIEILKENDFHLHFASPAQSGEHSYDLSQLNVTARVLPINDSVADDYFKELSPDLVIFDRFTTEEQFGWRLSSSCPDCLRILDTEDLHCLRAERQKAVKSNRDFRSEDLLSSEIAFREIASIYRCDLSLIISKAELEILRSVFRIDDSLLHYIPLFIEMPDLNTDLLFEQRNHFVSIGNFLHEPNRDSIVQLREKIWPLIRKKLPQAEMHVYGAYADEQVKQLHSEKTGFLIKGRAKHVAGVFKSAKVCLAYLRFGAGLKGKLLDAMHMGVPSITTTVGSEGIADKDSWPGVVEDDPEKFAGAAVQLYSDKTRWEEKQNHIPAILKQFDKTIHSPALLKKIELLFSSLNAHRAQNIIGSMLQHHSAQSTKYMAMWIEAKNKLATILKPEL